MREMKDSGIQWIGKIPKNWDVRPIKNSFSIVSGSTPDSDKAEYWEGGIPWITPADFKTIDKYTSGGSRFITEKGYDSCSTNMIPKGSIIFSKRAPIGSVVINKIDLCTNQGCLSCIKNDKTDSAYFYYLMSIYDDVFNLFGSGTTFKEISATTFGNFILPLPPLMEQHLVSSFLDSKCSEIDALTADIQKEIETLQEYRKSVITEAVTKGLDPNVEMKDSGVEWIGEIPVHWSVIPFYRLIDQMNDSIVDGPFGSDMKNEEYVDEGVPVIQLGAIKESGMDFSKMHFITESKADTLQRHNAYPKDLAIAKMMPAGRSCEIPTTYERYVVSADVIKVSISNTELRHFINYALNTYIKEWANTVTSGSTRSRINIEKLKKFKFAIPNTMEMGHILEILDDKISEIDSIISDKQKQLDTLAEYRKSLIYEYVTGKKEVPTT